MFDSLLDRGISARTVPDFRQPGLARYLNAIAACLFILLPTVALVAMLS